VDLEPGTYTFYLKARMRGGKWTEIKNSLHIIISPAWWQTDLFKIFIALLAILLSWFIILWRVKMVRREEHARSIHEKELLELEAKALRAQMNPHFIFNCMNSIKSLIQEHEEVKAINYLTTFSKLIRTIFQNSDKKDISLYDEIETCKFYLQLEAMRFDAAFTYTINIDPEMDLKSVNIPALIIQPFIENAIWHGIVPGGNGGNIRLDVERNNDQVEIIVEDDGIGREVSRQNKSKSRLTHDSKGVNLTQSRLELDNSLKQRNAKIEIIDKKDECGNVLGTKVIIKIQEEKE
jgi:sensor histidine kinase YesM